MIIVYLIYIDMLHIFSPLPRPIMHILAERHKEIVGDAAAAGFDLGGNRHAGGDRLLAAIDAQRRPVERDMGDVDRRGLALPGGRPPPLAAARIADARIIPLPPPAP